jgi:hypothetical protein
MLEWKEGLKTIPTSWLLLFSYSMIIFINVTLIIVVVNCCIFILCRVFIVCVFLYTVFRLIVVLFCVMCVICVLCLIIVPLPPGENPFAVKIYIYIYVWMFDDVSKEYTAFTFIIQERSWNQATSTTPHAACMLPRLTLRPWKWSQYVPPKSR